jgi:hypothetical protein
MNPARKALIEAAREEHLAIAAICSEKRRELRDVVRREAEARARLDRLRDSDGGNPRPGNR